MSILASEIIYNIKNLKAGGISTDDNKMSDAQWMFIIDYYRSILIRRDISKGYKVNQECIQILSPEKIILSQNSIEKCELISNNIPKLVETTNGNLFTFVGTQGGLSYQKTTYLKSQWDKYSKFIGSLPKYYELGEKLIVRFHQKNLKLNVQGIFERPIQVEEFNGTINELDPYNFNYPISNVMLDSVIKMIMESELKLSLLLPKDELNDGRDGQ